MLTYEIKNFLDHHLGYDASISSTQKEKVKKLLLANEFNPLFSFFDYITHYESKCGRGNSSIGFGDIIELLEDTKWNNHLYEQGIPTHYIAMKKTSDWLFLYNTNDDSVILNDDDNINRLINEDFDYYWPSFNSFLM